MSSQISVSTAQTATFRMHRILLDGRHVDSEKRSQEVSSWTLQPIAEVHDATADQARAAGEAARKVAPAMRAMTAAQRSEALRRIALGIGDRIEEFATLIRDEVGKPMNLARTEVQRAARTFQIAADE